MTARTHGGRFLTAAIFVPLAAVLACLPLTAQNLPIVARASSVTGRVLISGSAAQPLPLTRGYVLSPGERVDTRGGGRVVIELTDGSMVVVQPGTVLVFKDFLSAGTLRELFDITLGHVRVKINHYSGRPNPYRMNSPTASIAVRGTEFAIEVDAQGVTEVFVYEGSVEVTSLADPGRSVLIEAGRGVRVASGQDFRIVNTAPRTERAERAESGSRESDEGNTKAAASSRSSTSEDREATSPRALAGTYERYIAGLAQIAQLPFLHRFNAFAENHLDSLENPAYATEFRQAEGRLFVLPSFRGVGGAGGSDSGFGPGASLSADYSVAPEFSLFAPVGKRATIGGSFTALRVGSASTLPSAELESEAENSGNSSALATSGNSNSHFYSGSFLAAVRLGAEGRTGLGFEAERMNGAGSLLSLALGGESGSTPYDRIESRSDISQTRLTFGISRAIGKTNKLGGYYRYGLIDATDRETSHTLRGRPQGLSSTLSSGHSSEFGMRMRGEITPRILYGVTGAWLGLSLGDGLTRSATVASHQRDRTQRGSLAVGIGFVATPRIVLSLDLAGGASSIKASRSADLGASLLQSGNSDSRFVSVHGAIQANVTQHLFATASLLAVRRSYSLNVNVFPDRFGSVVPVSDTFFPLLASAYRQGTRFSDFGIGWRFSRDLFAQYVFSTDYGFSTPSHTLMLRYTFHIKRK